MNSKYSYNTTTGTRSGAFNVYQGKNGAIYLLMGYNAVVLQKEQVEKLIGSNLYELYDFRLDDYNNYYDKLKEDNAFLLKNIERLKVCAKKVLQYPKGSQGYDPIDAINLEDAIKKAQ